MKVILIAWLAMSIVATMPSLARSANPALTSDCHPQTDIAKKQYIIGYGSLMERSSRLGTVPNASTAHPIKLKDFQRSWSVWGPPFGYGTTFLGVDKKPGAQFNAVVYTVPSNKDIVATDRRERPYCRTRADISLITMLDSSQLPDGEVWIYVTKPKHMSSPSQKFPIAQSYVDVFLSGCLQVKKDYQLEEFAVECIRSTTGWSTNWVNDRIMPRRPFVHQPNSMTIDRMLSKELPTYFDKIRIE